LTASAGSTISGCRHGRSADEIANGGGDFRAVRFQRKVARVKKSNIRAWDVALVGLGPGRQEERIVASVSS
jgi:hypothetical protein